MKERSILFQGAMVRALLAGTKTQTRRIVKPTTGRPIDFLGGGPKGGADWNDPECWGYEHHDSATWVLLKADKTAETAQYPCPYGWRGDRLWVRETWGYFDPDGSGEDYDRDRNDEGKAGPCTAYRQEMLEEGNALRDFWRRRIAYAATWQEKPYGAGVPGPKRWRPSIHMPRWACRITLEITGVRVERLQEISDADAIEEGVDRTNTSISGYARERYRQLWESINGTGSWEANPWCWVVEFRRVQP